MKICEDLVTHGGSDISDPYLILKKKLCSFKKFYNEEGIFQISLTIPAI